MHVSRAVLWSILIGFVVVTAVAVYLVNTNVVRDSSIPEAELEAGEPTQYDVPTF